MEILVPQLTQGLHEPDLLGRQEMSNDTHI